MLKAEPYLGIAFSQRTVGPAAEAAVVAVGLALHTHLQVGADAVEEDVVGGPAPSGQLAGQHVLAAALDDRRVGGYMRIGRQHLHSVAAQAHVASAETKPNIFVAREKKEQLVFAETFPGRDEYFLIAIAYWKGGGGVVELAPRSPASQADTDTHYPQKIGYKIVGVSLICYKTECTIAALRKIYDENR